MLINAAWIVAIILSVKMYPIDFFQWLLNPTNKNIRASDAMISGAFKGHSQQNHRIYCWLAPIGLLYGHCI
jgi:ABC-type nickel/cobalt efflux system permease component RcnA